MNRLLNLVRDNFRSILTVSFFVMTAVMVTYLLPREGKFMYEYQQGGFWRHDDLTAPFSFPVYKSESELKQERDSAIKEFRPVFIYNGKISVLRIRELQTDFSRQWLEFSLTALKVPSAEAYRNDKRFVAHRQLESEYLQLLTSLVQETYSKGIIDMAPLEEKGRVPYHEITLVRGNVAENVPLSALYTPRSAYEYITERLKSNIPRKGNPAIRQYDPFIMDFELNIYLSINILYDEAISKNIRKGLINGISLTRGLVQEGQGIIAKGEFISDDKYLILESLRKEYEQNLGLMSRKMVVAGKFILVMVSFLVIYMFLRSFRREVLDSYSRISFILMTVLLMILFASTTINFNVISIYLIPFTILPIVLKTFFDSRLAFFVHIITVLLVGFFVPNGFEFVFLNIVAGIIAIISLTNVYRRSKFVVTSVYVILAYSVVYLAIALVRSGDLTHVELKYFRWFAVNGLMILGAYPLIFLFEKTFGFISDATLMELSDSNQPLLRKLAELAPGTFQHSLQVANLAEDAVFHVGGNPLLVRAGALYHDIGKMEDAMFFIENQTTQVNPHDDLEFEQSARIIIDHVRKGVELAHKHKLPESVIDFIRTHHGTSTVQYFYRSFLRKYPEAEVNLKDFIYPGPRPMSVETAIVMMADSVEAASRSLKTISESTLDKLVDQIINTQMNDGQFNDARISFKDLTEIRQVFKKRLMNIYHVRITYPGSES